MNLLDTQIEGLCSYLKRVFPLVKFDFSTYSTATSYDVKTFLVCKCYLKDKVLFTNSNTMPKVVSYSKPSNIEHHSLL